MRRWRELWNNLPERGPFPPDAVSDLDRMQKEYQEMKEKIFALKGELFEKAVALFKELEKDWSKKEIFTAMRITGWKIPVTWPWQNASDLFDLYDKDTINK